MSKKTSEHSKNTDELSDNNYLNLIKHFLLEKGFDYKLYNNNYLNKRIKSRMSSIEIDNFRDYYNYILKDQQNEYNNLIKNIGLTVTRFFRNIEIWEYIKKDILSDYFKTNFIGVKSLNTWSAGCGNGAEAYSLAIMLTEFFTENPLIISSYNLWASDYHIENIKAAKKGYFNKIDLLEVSEDHKNKYFDERNLSNKVTIKNGKSSLNNSYQEKITKGDEIFKINDQLKNKVNFFVHNLADKFPFEKNNLVIIMCRYVLMFFNKDSKMAILSEFHRILRINGILIIGKTEKIDNISELGFEVLNKEFNIYRKI